MHRNIHKRMRSSVIMLLLSAPFLLMISASTALAHSPVLWCYVEDGKVHVEAFFNNGRKVRGAQIVVVNQNGKKLIEGHTNEEGLFQFDYKGKDDITIVLKVDADHVANFTLTKQDFLDAEKEAVGQELK